MSHAVELSSESLITMAFKRPLPRTMLTKSRLIDQFLHFFPKKIAKDKRIFCKFFLFNHFQGGNSHSTCQRVASKSRTMVSRAYNLHHPIIGQYGRHREKHPRKGLSLISGYRVLPLAFHYSIYRDKNNYRKWPIIFLSLQFPFGLHQQ